MKESKMKKDITIKYLSWLKDKKITQYTEQKYKKTFY